MKTYDLGAILETIYGFEINIRIQSYPDKGFYGCFTNNQIMWRGVTLSDFDRPEATPITEIVKQAEINQFYSSTSIENLCNFLFEHAIRLEDNKSDKRMINEVRKQGKTNLEDVLYKACDKGVQFIIESAWDLGFDVYLLKNKKTKKITSLNSYSVNEIGFWIERELDTKKQGAKNV